MKVLMITGDKKFTAGNERYELQKSAVENLTVVYWGFGSIWPDIPAGHFDVVTVQDPFMRGLFGVWTAKQRGAKLNVQVHTDLSVYTGLRHILMQIVLRHADTVRVVTDKIKSQVERIGVQARITVLPVFVDVERFKAVKHRPHPQKTILWIGRYEDEKNPLAAIEVLEHVLKEKIDAKLVFLGSGSLRGELFSKAAGKPVEVRGFEDTAGHLAVADVVLCTSKHESWGASIVEALAAGVPVVAPDIGIAKEAGATIWPREELHKGVLEVLASGQKGQLQIQLLDKDTWAKMWAASL